MSGSAKITSIDAVENFRLALMKFNDNAVRALMSIDEQTKRALHWFEHEAPTEWNMRIRKCHEDVERARSALDTCLTKKVGDNRPSCMEEKQALQAAKRRLAHAQEMLDVIRVWTTRIRQACDDYRGGVMGLRTTLDTRVPETVAMLSRTVRALDSYTEQNREKNDSSSAPKPSVQPETTSDEIKP